MRTANESDVNRISRQLDKGDVNDHLITASDPSHQPPPPSRDLASLMKLPFGCGGRVRLPATPEAGEVADPFDELEISSSTKSSRQGKRRRYLIIGTSITLWLLLVVIYVADVNRSWLALEDKWKVS
jgi:hypothetical protein